GAAEEPEQPFRGQPWDALAHQVGQKLEGDEQDRARNPQPQRHLPTASSSVARTARREPESHRPSGQSGSKRRHLTGGVPPVQPSSTAAASGTTATAV